ncbi:MAG: peptide antibiotic transporter SbmA [Gammaproteobacteria bacterium]|nr:peptide antibiotic transporter SbmA [Gammaproteobacteria bacterium]
MFVSFFPKPKLFFWSAVAWFLIALAAWHGFVLDLGAQLTLFQPVESAEGGAAAFLTLEKVWVYQYIVFCSVVFCLFWYFYERNKWYWWAVVGSTLILLITYTNVQVSVWLNSWYGEFYNLIQEALAEPNKYELSEYFLKMTTAVFVLIPNILLLVIGAFFTSHYVFRWRTAMNEYYMVNWQQARDVEGAAQRVQEDTMRFAGIMETLGSSLIGSVMTLIAFLPVLMSLSEQVGSIWLLGDIKGGLVYVAIASALFGTVLMAAVGIRLPGLEFENQKVEAAYRKELVYGEDNAARCEPMTVKELFHDVRVNRFRLYFNYLYFNVFRYSYLQFSNFLPYLALGPAIVTGAITFGIFRQVLDAFSRVENSFQYLVNAWPTIIDLMSIHKRLKQFEGAIDNPINPTLDPSKAL